VLLRFVQLLAQLRRGHAEFHRETFLKGAASRAGVKDVTWLNAGGTEMKQGEWQDANLRALGIWFGKRSYAEGRLLLLMNAAETAQTFTLPGTEADGPWICQFDTSLDAHEVMSLGRMRE